SPLARAVDTARAVAAPHGLSPVTCEDLREIELGEVEGLQFDDYPSELQTALLNAPGEVRFPGGESYEQLRARVVAALEEIVAQHGGETVVAVSHACPIRAALAPGLSVGPDAAFRIGQQCGGVHVARWGEGGGGGGVGKGVGRGG